MPSGWSPLELLKHLTLMERRWLVWGFEGQVVPDPWGDEQDGRWYVRPEEGLADLVAASHRQAARTRQVVRAHRLSDIGQPSARWDGADPPPLERVLLHILQEYARHGGHLDGVREIVDGQVGE